MGLLYFLADMFINTFGITQPSEKARKQAAFFILVLILLVLAGMVATFIAVRAAMR